MRSILLTLICSLLTNWALGQLIDKVEQIRNTVAKINSDTSYTTKSLESEQFLEHAPDGGGQLTGYFNNSQLVKIVKEIGLSSCSIVFEYYLQDNILISVYGQEIVFEFVDSTGSLDYTKQAVGMECKFYFENGKLLKSNFTGQTRCIDPPSDAQIQYLFDDLKQYLDLFKEY
jgi:hypothetical protein